MEKYELEFKVCRDNEAKEAKESHTVKVTVVADEDATTKYMKKAAAVWIQAQIRSNWDTFIKDGVPSEVTLDAPIWGKGRGKVTVEKATDLLKTKMSEMTQKEKLAYLKEMGVL